jgi:hypothetical protein
MKINLVEGLFRFHKVSDGDARLLPVKGSIQVQVIPQLEYMTGMMSLKRATKPYLAEESGNTIHSKTNDI